RWGIPPGYKGAIEKSIPKQTGTFLVYGSMEMFVYAEGEDDLIGEDTTSAIFWLRLAQGKDQYYEVRQPVYSGGPDEKHQGWDSRNHISINMAELASLKLRDTSDTEIVVDTVSIPGYFLKDETMEVYIRGDPSLERIDHYVAGIINRGDDTLRGRVMIDELRLTDVKRKGGLAMRLSGGVNFADLLTTSFNYARKDADFHNVQQRVSRNAATTENWRVDMTFNPNRFLPESWGIRIPMSASFSSAISSPKYFPGKDIPAGGIREAPDSVQNQSRQLALKTSFDKSTRSQNWLVRQTFDRLRGSIAYTRKLQSTELIKSNESRSISGQVSYPIRFSDESYVQPFQVLGSIPWLGERIKDTRLYYAPTNIDFSANVTESLNNRTARASPDSVMDTYNFNMARAVSGRYRVTDHLSADYSWNANNVLNEFRDRELEAFTMLNPGITRQFAERFTTSYNPELISWFKPKFMYTANYSWVKNAPIDDPLRGGRISAQGRLTGNVTLQLRDIIEVFYTPEGGSAPGSSQGVQRRTAPAGDDQSSQSDKPFEVANPQIKALLKQLHTAAGKVVPITVNYSYSRQAGEPAVRGQPSYAYRLALITDSGLEADTARVGRFDMSTLRVSRDLSWRSGLSLSRSVNMSFSHSRRFSETQSRSAETRATTWDWIYFEKHPNSGIPFVNWNLRWSNLEQLPLFSKVPWRVNLDHSYSGNRTRTIQNMRAPIDRYTRRFQPLVGLTFNFDNGVATNVRLSHTVNLDRNENGNTKTTNQQLTATVSYRHQGGLTIPFPFFDDFYLQNTVNFDLSFDYTSGNEYSLKGAAIDRTHSKWNKKWSVTPRITYTFSDKVTGGFHIVYSENDDYLYGKRINRDFKFDVNIAIRGS
ncbi:MAG: hypothetical protein JSW54_03140, partial [Fidelibacterota bacterium]